MSCFRVGSPFETVSLQHRNIEVVKSMVLTFDSSITLTYKGKLLVSTMPCAVSTRHSPVLQWHWRKCGTSCARPRMGSNVSWHGTIVVCHNSAVVVFASPTIPHHH